MKFSALQFNGTRVDISGQYSQRIDGSLILELDKRIPFREVCRLTRECISYLWIGRTGGGNWLVHKGPYTLKEQYGLIILSPDKEDRKL
ncbi:hypothetical protein DXT76_19050 [Halobacillus trueperi]|uniref:Uncharacterized protein n=1 Tax=Halobacillus trueperi TaxID=156205 RepID=A0A3D8VE49_9BACI|nr:hypothetical protein DXT76_19050 [Halobacillus trueperi]